MYSPDEAPEKNTDLFFSGQITHERRLSIANSLKDIDKNTGFTGIKLKYYLSDGFTKGLPPKEYIESMNAAKVAPAPSGPETPDTFRLFEALEAGCIPFADCKAPKNDFPDDYWTWFFGEEPPFPVTTGWGWLEGWTVDNSRLFPIKNNRIFAWWQRKKYEFVQSIKEEIRTLSDIEPDEPKITVLMPSNVIPRHPSTDHIEQTIRDVRTQLPDADIFIMLDGVRTEQEERREDYEEYQRRLLWLCNYKWTNVLPIRFEEFGHQSTMTKRVIEMVKTPFVCFVEHDTPLVPDFAIEWDKLCAAIDTGEANAIRLCHEAKIHPEHKHMMIGKPMNVQGATMLRTSQWSQRPHLASTAFYKHILSTYFSDSSKAFIEHGLYGPCVEAYNRDGVYGWNLWKLWVYYPDEDNIKRSYDLNSRENAPNFESIF